MEIAIEEQLPEDPEVMVNINFDSLSDAINLLHFEFLSDLCSGALYILWFASFPSFDNCLLTPIRIFVCVYFVCSMLF